MIGHTIEEHALLYRIHELARRGVKAPQIAEATGLGERRVYRWLDKPCPSPPSVIDNTWKNRAACSGHDPALWFGTGERGPTDEQTRQAKAICAQCPVRQLCLANAEPSGTWGGLTEQERRTLRRKRRAA